MLWRFELYYSLVLCAQLLNAPYLISAHWRLGAAMGVGLLISGIMLTPVAALLAASDQPWLGYLLFMAVSGVILGPTLSTPSSPDARYTTFWILVFVGTQAGLGGHAAYLMPGQASGPPPPLPPFPAPLP